MEYINELAGIVIITVLFLLCLYLDTIYTGWLCGCCDWRGEEPYFNGDMNQCPRCGEPADFCGTIDEEKEWWDKWYERSSGDDHQTVESP